MRQGRAVWGAGSAPWVPQLSVCPVSRRIPELTQGAQGVYVCRASAPGGQAEDRATLAVQGRSTLT